MRNEEILVDHLENNITSNKKAHDSYTDTFNRVPIPKQLNNLNSV